MKLVDVDELRKNGYECVTAFDEYGEPYNCESLDNIPTVDAIVIPKNATNGDMIKAMFPNAKWWVNEDNEVFTDMPWKSERGKFMYFPLDWWNAPYKKGE